MVNDQRERESLKDETRTAIEEVRMVLPGIQALFGFQMIAVFNERFQRLPASAQQLHIAAIAFVALAIALVMAPAAYHRIGERGWVSRRLINLTSNYLTAAMVALTIGLSVDLGLVGGIVLLSWIWGMALGVLMGVACTVYWIVLPLIHRARFRPN
jgi:hypothetical protein